MNEHKSFLAHDVPYCMTIAERMSHTNNECIVSNVHTVCMPRRVNFFAVLMYATTCQPCLRSSVVQYTGTRGVGSTYEKCSRLLCLRLLLSLGQLPPSENVPGSGHLELQTESS